VDGYEVDGSALEVGPYVTVVVGSMVVEELDKAQ
jgi:hypothetical protein